ncbi:hypothetical protein I5C44_04415 [Staphylococcus aureus]|nr:hypothetical protein I5C44_04415 [Staphylococcus aureus]
MQAKLTKKEFIEVKPVASAWKRNKYGTYYMEENARFTNGNQPITVRKIGPFS